MRSGDNDDTEPRTFAKVVFEYKVAGKSYRGDRVSIGEDLGNVGPVALLQDLSVMALLGIPHVERNGHHYVSGFATAPAHEARAFLDAHPDLYQDDGKSIRLAIHDGALSTASLAAPGFASGAEPDWASLSPLATPTPRFIKEHA